MSLSEYYRKFQECLPEKIGTDFPRDIAACIAAGHAVGLSPEQLRQFMARRAEVSSVTIALVKKTISPEVLEKVVSLREAGAVYPKEVLAHFPPEEVEKKFHVATFGHDESA